jgi:hypothetical protein
MVILDLIFGFILLFAGRTMFWLCVGIVGFLLGVQSTAYLGLTTNGPTALLISLGCGLLGIVLAVAFEWFMVVFGVGFLGGGYLLMSIFPSVAGQESYSWLIFVAGGIVGMCLMIIIFDWTLIMISSLLGATLIVNAFHGTVGFREFLFVSSMVVGILVQYFTLRALTVQEHPASLSAPR